jgi:hypothetical protein
MAFSYRNSKGQTYYLHAKVTKRADGSQSKLFYFSKTPKPGETLDTVPAGYQVAEMKTGLPVLKKG